MNPRPLLPYARRFLAYKAKLLGGFLAIPLSQLADIQITLVIGGALNRLQRGETEGFLRTAFLVVIAYALLHGVLRFMTRWWIVAVSRWFERDLKRDVFAKLTALSFSFHDKSRSGDVVSRITSDVENLRMFLGPGLMYAASALIVLPVSFFVLARIDLALTLCMALPLLVIAFSMKLLGPRLEKSSREVQESISDIGHRAQDAFAGIRVLKGYGREEEEARRFEALSRENMEKQVELARARGLSHSIAQGSFELTLVVILVVGGVALMRGEMLSGDLFKFIDLTIKMFWPVIALGWLAGVYPRAVTSALRVDEILGLAPDIADPPQPREPPEPRGALRFEHLHFRYPGASQPSLQGVSVAVGAGETLGIVGPTGSGKSTLLALVGRLYDTRGAVLVDGVPVEEWRLSALRALLAYVPQDGFLFSETWRENVGFGAERALDDAELEELARLACMREELARFPGGLDQLIGERGVTLSGGQRQRTAIARALARKAQILVLDDCLSAVDTQTERELLANLRRASRGRTVLIAAHRLSAVAEADRILVLGPAGLPLDQGTHEELVARTGWYRETWLRQEAREELEEL